jgi:hypothetical protein
MDAITYYRDPPGTWDSRKRTMELDATLVRGSEGGGGGVEANSGGSTWKVTHAFSVATVRLASREASFFLY